MLLREIKKKNKRIEKRQENNYTLKPIFIIKQRNLDKNFHSSTGSIGRLLLIHIRGKVLPGYSVSVGKGSLKRIMSTLSRFSASNRIISILESVTRLRLDFQNKS